MPLTAIEQAAADIVKKAAPKIVLTDYTSPHGGERIEIRGINVEELPSKYLINALEIREIAQAMRIVCEDIQNMGDRLLDFNVKQEANGSYTLLCQADVPGRVLGPLKEKLNINLSKRGMTSGAVS